MRNGGVRCARFLALQTLDRRPEHHLHTAKSSLHFGHESILLINLSNMRRRFAPGHPQRESPEGAAGTWLNFSDVRRLSAKH